jgi:amino acid transporter
VNISLASSVIILGAIMPSAGGDFDYLKRAYGPRVAFSFAWYNFFIGKTGSQAIISLIFGRYFEAVLLNDLNRLQFSSSSSSSSSTNSESYTSKFLAITLIILTTFINCVGIKESAIFSIILTITKVMLVLLVFLFAIIFILTHTSNSTIAYHNLSPKYSFDGTKDIFYFGSGS